MLPRTFDFEEKLLEKEIRNRRAKLILIQLPEGLKPYAQRLASIIERAGALAIVSADSCYGACDLALVEAERLGVDLIVHYGHSEMMKQTTLPILYIEAKAKIPVKAAMKKAVSFLTWKKIGLVTTVQHVHKLDEARKMLLKCGKIVEIGDSGSLRYAGQILGCDYSNARAILEKVDAFLFIGGGKFHAIGVALATGKATIAADPYENRAFTVCDEVKEILKKRWANIHEAKQAKRVGICIGLKTGQKRIDKALRIKSLLDKAGKVATLFALKEISPEALMQFPTIDAFVNTACPRLSLDDAEKFRKPLLTPNETLVVLGKLSWEELCTEGWFES